MAYSNNPLLPKARRWAVNLVLREGLSVSLAARRAGIHRSTLYRWMQKARVLELAWNARIPTDSSRPHHHPRQLSQAVVERICQLRRQLRRCAAYIHAVLQREGVRVSLASVGRVLARSELLDIRYKPRGKVRRARIPRPKVTRPGDLVQVDTIHFYDWRTKQRHYLYTLIDLKTRWVYAEAAADIHPAASAGFVLRALGRFPHHCKVIQTDNGQEFGNAFEAALHRRGIRQRRIRLGRKNDNAHIERFNRTVQDECLGRWPAPPSIPKLLKEYLEFYNTIRLHSGIQYRTPFEVLQRF